MPLAEIRFFLEAIMRKLILAATLVFPMAAQTQPAGDANQEGSALDPDSKARVRTEGSTGGIKGGMKTDEQKKGASAGGSSGRPNRSSKGLERQQGGRVHDETSSDREEGRGARGAIR
jgi:hypothetical protein